MNSPYNFAHVLQHCIFFAMNCIDFAVHLFLSLMIFALRILDTVFQRATIVLIMISNEFVSAAIGSPTLIDEAARSIVYYVGRINNALHRAASWRWRRIKTA